METVYSTNPDQTLHTALPTQVTAKQRLSQLLTNLYPWVVIAFCSLFLFYKYVLQVSPAVMTHELMVYFHLNGVGLGNLAATYFYTYLVTQLFVGPLLDKYNPRRLTTIAIVVSASGALLFATAHALDMALLGRGLIGVGAAFATVSYMKMATIWFKPQRFAFVGGLLATAAMVGSMAGQTPLALLIDHTGFHQALYYVGLAGLLFALLFYLLVRDPRTTHHTSTLSPPSNVHKLQLKDFLHLLTKRYNWLLMFYSGLAFAPVAVFGGLWGNPFLCEVFHIDKSMAAILTSMMFFGLALGGPVLGFMADRTRNTPRVMLIGGILSLVSLLAALYFPPISLPLEGVWLFLVGFGTGAFMLGFAVGKTLNPLPLAGTVIGLINTGDALLGALSEPLVGKVLDLFWKGKMVKDAEYFTVHQFHLAFCLLPLYLVIALCLLGGLRKCSAHNNKGR